MNIRVFAVGALTSLTTAILMPSVVERRLSGTAFKPENIGILPIVALVGGFAAFIAVRGARAIGVGK